MTNNLLNHPTFTSARDLTNICSPLQELKIDSFSHVKSDSTENFSFLATNPDFIEYYFKKKYFNYDIHTCDISNLGNYIIWDLIPRTGKTLEMEKEVAQFGIKHTFTIIEKSTDENNFYHFSSSVESKTINQVYLSNLELLTRFINQFKKTTAQSKILSHAYNMKFNLDQDTTGFSTDKNDIEINRNVADSFNAKLKLPKLSPREEDCLTYSARGKSAKEIAMILGLSYRTIETYLENIKIKFNVTSKSQLIEKWFEFYYIYP